MASAKATIDHETIRKWVEAKGGCPAQVKRTGKDDDVGIIRIDYPGFSGKESLEKISWQEWFEKFEESKLAFLYQDESDSRFSKLVKRDSVEVEQGDSHRESERHESVDALNLLKQDHDKVKKLFAKIRSYEDIKREFQTVKTELETHSGIEEAVFYPALKKHKEFNEMIEKAEAEHGLVKELLRKMEKQEGSELEQNFETLMANVQLHIGEEEGQIFPRVRKAKELDLQELGEELQGAKEKHMARGRKSPRRQKRRSKHHEGAWA